LRQSPVEVNLDPVSLAYGHTTCTVSLPESGVVVLTGKQSPSARVPEETLIQRALEAPYGMGRLSELVRPGQ